MAESLYERIGGSERIHAVIWRFYELVEADAELRAIYPDDLAPGREKLALYLEQWLGGPGTYSERYGHPRLRMRHLPFRVTPPGAQSWLTHMRQAMSDAGLAEADAQQIMSALEPLARHMVNQ